MSSTDRPSPASPALLTAADRLAEAGRDACVEAALDAFEDASMSGLCCTGAWECAVGAVRTLDLGPAVADDRGPLLAARPPHKETLTAVDREHLARCVALAEEALDAGDEPFGSVLVGPDGGVLREARNRAVTGDPTRHPELELAQWAAAHLGADARAAATVYTSGEHCPMCAAAHAWAGLGRIVYASSASQLARWLGAFGAAAPPVPPLPVWAVAPDVPVSGPDLALAPRVRDLHRRFHLGDAPSSD